GGDELVGGVAERGEARARAEYHETDGECAFAAEAVTERPAREQEPGEHEGVGVDDPLELGGAGVELADECGDGDVEHGVGGEHHFPRLTTCPSCSSGACEEILLSDRGSLWVWTAVTAPPPGYRGEVPFGFGVVELPEGLRVITRLTEALPSRLVFGQSMRLAVVPLHVDDDGRTVVTYAFTPS